MFAHESKSASDNHEQQVFFFRTRDEALRFIFAEFRDSEEIDLSKLFYQASVLLGYVKHDNEFYYIWESDVCRQIKEIINSKPTKDKLTPKQIQQLEEVVVWLEPIKPVNPSPRRDAVLSRLFSRLRSWFRQRSLAEKVLIVSGLVFLVGLILLVTGGGPGLLAAGICLVGALGVLTGVSVVIADKMKGCVPLRNNVSQPTAPGPGVSHLGIHANLKQSGRGKASGAQNANLDETLDPLVRKSPTAACAPSQQPKNKAEPAKGAVFTGMHPKR